MASEKQMTKKFLAKISITDGHFELKNDRNLFKVYIKYI